MRRLVALAPLFVAACSTMAAEEPQPSAVGETPGYTCKNEGLEAFVGREPSPEVEKEILAKSGAKTLRWVTPGMMVTMDFRADRVTAHVDSNARIERVRCG